MRNGPGIVARPVSTAVCQLARACGLCFAATGALEQAFGQHEGDVGAGVEISLRRDAADRHRHAERAVIGEHARVAALQSGAAGKTQHPVRISDHQQPVGEKFAPDYPVELRVGRQPAAIVARDHLEVAALHFSQCERSEPHRVDLRRRDPVRRLARTMDQQAQARDEARIGAAHAARARVDRESEGPLPVDARLDINAPVDRTERNAEQWIGARSLHLRTGGGLGRLRRSAGERQRDCPNSESSKPRHAPPFPIGDIFMQYT